MPSIPGGSVRVLHVDDEPSFGELTATYLERESDQFDVETVASADEGMATLADHRPDCIVSDYDMPGKDGLEFLEAVRETHPDLPFILFTGRGSEQVASDAIAADVTDYLQKGSGSEQYELLANRIRNAVESRRNAQAAARQEELMRLTEFAGDTGGWEFDLETEELVMTDGVRRLVGLPDDVELSLADAKAMYHPDDREDIQRALDRVIETGEPDESTWRLITRDGEEMVVDLVMSPVITNGEVTKVRGSVHDITDRRERRRELERTETLFQHAQDSLFLVDTGEEFTVEQVNPAWEDATGVPADRIEGESPREVFGETGAEMEAMYRECIERCEPLQYDEQVSLDGELTHWETKIAPVVFDDTVEYIAGSTRDVTEQRERQRNLEAERRFIEQALDTLDDIFYVVDTDGSIRRWNEQLPAVTGYDDSELDGMDAVALFPADEHETVIETIEATLTGGATTVQADLQSADGERVPHEFRGQRLTDEDGETTGLVGIGRDLTERRRRQRRFRALVKESNDIVSVVDAEGVYQYQSPSLEHILGYDPEETVGDSAWEYIHPDDKQAVAEAFEEWIKNTGETVVAEYRVRHADGSWRWIESRGNNHVDNSGIEGFVINSRDITERKKGERELEQTRELMSNMEELADVGAWEYDPETDQLVLTDGAYRIYGADPDTDLSLEEAFDSFQPEDRELLIERFNRCLETGNPYELDLRITTGEGRRRWVTARGERVDRADGSVAIRGYIRDITERKTREQQLTELNRATQTLLTAESEQAVADIGVEAASDALSLQASAICLADADDTELVPVAGTGKLASSVDDSDPIPVADSVAGQVYRDGEPVVVDDARQDMDRHDPERALGGQLSLPLGDHGVLLADPGEAVVDSGTVALGELLAGTVTAALDRVDRERTARRRQQQLSLFFEESPLGAVEWDENFRFDRLNDRAEEILGYEEAELRGESWERIVDGDDRRAVGDAVESLLAADGGTHVINRNVRKSGETVTCEWHNRAVTDEDGEVRSIFSKFQDVTDRERRRSELEKYETIVESLTDAVYVLDAAGRFTNVNEEFVDMVGYDRETILGSRPSLIKDDRAVENAEHQLGRLLSSDGPETVRFEVTIHPQEGDPIVCQDHMGVLPYEGDSFDGSVGVLREITDRKERERELQRIKGQYQTLVENFPDGAVFLYDTELRVVRAGGAELSEVGLSSDEVEGSTPRERYPPNVAETLIDHLEDALAGEETVFEQSYQGNQYRIQAVPVRTNGGEITHVMAVSRNVTEQRRREQRLNRERQRYSTLFETLPNPALHASIEDGDPVVETVNQAFLDTFDCEAEAVVGEPLDEYVLPDDRVDETERLERQMRNEDLLRTEVCHETTDGRRSFQLSLRTRDTGSGDPEGYVVFTDITERTEYEQELEAQNERLDEFASIVSHDLRNPLTVVKSRLELARDECESEHLGRAADAVDRSQALIDDLLTLARRKDEVTETEPLALGDLAERSWQTVETTAATLDTDTTQVIQADHSQVQQLFENLYRNAVEHGGPGVTVHVSDLPDGFYVADTGPGIAADDREAVFEAGYSTAETGTGFGLRIVEQVADAHGWEVTATESQQGGARFEVTGVDIVDR
jgi:PAS domain S-box-containing protein